ncbi:glycosyltransferase family 2 protein [Chitinilyticum litopenaei]|uniref:glycosyltransferase family 2 protein n=1 Tax=Chitinilyticum litopenaei TaxID=1121276 RepID=UPI00042465CD|nr:glycosyltransferase family 2 protein [Chitinilyticum litopenaei]
MPPLVSICICAYNRADFIGESIDSALAQSYSNIEIIVVDDGSSDTTPGIIAEYAKAYPEKIRPFLLEENIGPCLVRNHAFQQARGKYIALLDSDDRMLPDRIHKQVEFMESHPDHVGVFTMIRAINAQGLPDQKLDEEAALFNMPINNLRYQLLHGNFLNAPSALILANTLKMQGGLEPTLTYLHDYDLWVRLLAIGEMARLPEILTEYRIHGGNLSIGDNVLRNSAQIGMEIAATINRAAQLWSINQIAGRALTTSKEIADLQLNIAGKLAGKDIELFGEPRMLTATAYDYVLRASWHDRPRAHALKLELEKCVANSAAQASAAIRLPPSQELYRLAQAGWSHPPRIILGSFVATSQFDLIIQTCQSLLAQIHENWNFHIVCFDSAPAGLPNDSRIIWHRLSDDDDSLEVINKILMNEYGDLVGAIYPGDRLPEEGLFHFALKLHTTPYLQWIYSDEMQISQDGTIHNPISNPQFQHELTDGSNYHGGLNLYRRELFSKLSGFDLAFEGVEDFDIAVRAAKTLPESEAFHLPENLYYRHKEGRMTSLNLEEEYSLRRHSIDRASNTTSNH